MRVGHQCFSRVGVVIAVKDEVEAPVMLPARMVRTVSTLNNELAV